ncbi:MAG: nuclease [Cellvibrionaceae bacterium]
MSLFKEITKELSDVIADGRLTISEKHQLQDLAKTLEPEKLSYLRNQAFTMSRQQIVEAGEEAEILAVMRWLERVVKIIDSAKGKDNYHASAYFSPGDECRSKLIELCRQAKSTIDVCVYTIADNQLTEAIISAHQRGVQVRVITDNAKSEDLGSDIDYMIEKKVPLVMDVSKYHMHHKFAIFDNEFLANGSFNWTRSATTSNEENIMVVNDSRLIKNFTDKFDELWNEYSK